MNEAKIKMGGESPLLSKVIRTDGFPTVSSIVRHDSRGTSRYQRVYTTGKKRITRPLNKKQSVRCGVRKLKLNEEYCKIEILRMSNPLFSASPP